LVIPEKGDIPFPDILIGEVMIGIHPCEEMEVVAHNAESKYFSEVQRAEPFQYTNHLIFFHIPEGIP